LPSPAAPASIGGDRHREVVLALGDQPRGAVEHGGALVRGKPSGLEDGAGGVDRLADESGVALGDPADQGLVVGGLDLRPLPGLGPLAGDVKLVIRCLNGLGRHLLSPH
jgi:hypothetical protein